MYVKKNFSFKDIIQFTGRHLIWLILWMTTAVCIFELFHFEWLKISWLPISLIGTAVAFYVGFKNNQAYDRLWEARKIWGGIVNSSRSWGASVRSYATNQFRENNLSDQELYTIHKRLIYTHIGWLFTLRNQLLIPTQWEHVSQGNKQAKRAAKRKEELGVGLTKDDVTEDCLRMFLPKEKYEQLINFKNTATQILDHQAQELKQLREDDIIDDFRHVELQELINEFYTLQGKCERIKKFPLPRQYGHMSGIFIGIFIFLLPWGMVNEFHDLSIYGAWVSIPFSVIVGWVFVMMELVGDYSENPFEGLGNDIPMLALSRTIEIDLREMLGESDLPPGIEPVNGILM